MNNRIINAGVAHVQDTDDGLYQLYIDKSTATWRSNDSGTTLTLVTLPAAVNEYCSGISGDGKYQLIGSSNSVYLYQSSNYGVSWSSVHSATLGVVYCCALSKDGKYQLICDSNNVWLSDDYGSTITSLGLGDHDWRNCAMDESGSVIAVMAADATDNKVYYSDDYGVSWASKDLLQQIGYGNAVSITGDGKKMFTCYNSHWPAKYTFATDTWTVPTTGAATLAVATSYNGKYICVGRTTSVFVSDDYGSSYTEVSLSADIRYMAMSSTGKYIIAGPTGTEGQKLSIDYGVSFSATIATSGSGIPAINRIH